MKEIYEAIVIGAGHAGCEASLALARKGHKTLLLTISLDAVAFLACNPSIGGTAKGQLVSEIDALGGQMGIIADKTAIQLRMLNRGRGPAVQSLRAQADKIKYHTEMKKVVESCPNLFLKQAEAEYQMTAYDVDRISKLVEKEILAEVRLKQAQAELAVAELEVEQAKVKMQRAQLDYSYTTITAPIDGYVDRIPYKVGSLVGTETLLTNISNVAEVFAYFKMNETEYLKFRRAIIRGEEDSRADTVQLVLADGTLYEHAGIVETVEGDFERQTGSIAFRARFPNPEGLLKHGVSGKINMMTKMDDVYLIPQQATFEIQEFTYVYTINEEDIAKIRSFEPLARFNGYYVAENFMPGTEIAFSGIQRLKDGMKIKPVDAGENSNPNESEGHVREMPDSTQANPDTEK